MPTPDYREEWRTRWLPHVSGGGVARLIELLERASPYLIRGAFVSAAPRGCLASHIAWHHPRTRHLHTEAGITWLSRIARLNPATSLVLLAWDAALPHECEVSGGLLNGLKVERERRAGVEKVPSFV